MEDPIVLINHPKKGTVIEGRSTRYSGGISETKDCAKCQHLNAVTSSKKTGYRLKEEHLLSIAGVCTWGYWKIVWRRDNPRKCVKLSAFFEKQYREKVCACYTEGKSLCGNKHSLNTIFHYKVTCPECREILKNQENK